MFRIESAGQQQALSKVTFLPHAGELYRTISRLLFPGDAAGGDDEPPPAAVSRLRAPTGRAAG